jgi:hypothetical protein
LLVTRTNLSTVAAEIDKQYFGSNQFAASSKLSVWRDILFAGRHKPHATFESVGARLDEFHHQPNK